MNYYFPSCNYTADNPKESQKIKKFLASKGFKIARCCRIDNKTLNVEDKGYTVCQSCSAFITESSKGDDESIFIYLDGLDDFKWPDYHGEKMTLQDCWKARNKPEVHNTVRSILKKMNIEVVELEKNREESDYCGLFLKNPSPAIGMKLAPVFFGEKEAVATILESAEEKQAYLEAHCNQYTTEKIVGYCSSCVRGIKQAGYNGIHLMNLIVRDLEG